MIETNGIDDLRQVVRNLSEENKKLKAVNAELLEALQNGVELMEYLINAMPSGTVRNSMCDFNIIARSALTL